MAISVLRKRGGVLVVRLLESNRCSRFVGQINARRLSSARALGGVIGGYTQEQRLTMTAASVVNGESLAGINADPNSGCRVIRVFAGPSENVDNQLAHRHCFVNAVGFGVIRFGDHRVQALIVEVNEYGVHALQDAVNGPVVKVQKAKRPSVAGLPLNVRHMKHLGQVQNVRVEVNPVHTIRHVTRQVREIGVTNVLFNLDILKRKLRNFPINPFRGPVLIPAVCSHFGLRLVSRTSISDNSVLETPLPEREPHHHTLTKSTANHYLWDALPRMIAELDVYVKLG